MKKILFLLFLLTNSIVFSAKKIKVSATILPQKYFISKIAGNMAEINIVIPPGANPVTYDLNPKKIRELSNSELYFKIGHLPFELSWMKKIESVNPAMQIVDTSKGVDFIISGHHHSSEPEHQKIDPHIWLSPKEVKIQAKNILNAFIKLDPQHHDFYSKNYKNFLSEIENLEISMYNNFEDLKIRKFLVYHPSWSYLVRDFNLEQIAVEVDGKNPTPKQLKNLIKTARNEKIKVIFLQKQFPVTVAKAISNEIDAQIIYLDPLSENWYENMLKISLLLNENLN